MPFKAIFIFFNSKSQDYNKDINKVNVFQLLVDIFLNPCYYSLHCFQRIIFMQHLMSHMRKKFCINMFISGIS